MAFPTVDPRTATISATSAVIGGAIGSLITYAATRKKNRKRKTSRRKAVRKNVHRSKSRKLKFGSKAYRKKYLKHGRRKRRTPHTAGKRPDTSHRRIRYTRRGQPYVIGAHGKARFISRKSAKSSYKRKGGRY